MFRLSRGCKLDLAHADADIDRKVACPTLVFYRGSGALAGLFDIPAEWRKRCEKIIETSLPGRHFSVDQFPERNSLPF